MLSTNEDNKWMNNSSDNKSVPDCRIQVREHKKKWESAGDLNDKVVLDVLGEGKRLQALHHNKYWMIADETVCARAHVHTVTKSGMTEEPLRNCAMARSTLDWIVRKPDVR
jgi:hypothetical protein